MSELEFARRVHELVTSQIALAEKLQAEQVRLQAQLSLLSAEGLRKVVLKPAISAALIGITAGLMKLIGV